MARTIILQAPHDPVTVARKLKAVVRDRIAEDSPRQITGNGSEAAMTLWVHHRHVRNSFKTLFAATLTAEAGGTLIEGRLGPARAVGWFMGCWLGFVGLFLIGGLAMIMGGAPLAFAGPFTLIPLAMFAFGLLLWWIATRSASTDAAAILAFLAETIDARPVTGDFPEPKRPLGR